MRDTSGATSKDDLIRVRGARSTDAKAITEIYATYVLTSPATFEIVPPDEDEFKARVEKVTDIYPWLVAEGPLGIEGYAYATRHRDRAAYQWAVDVSVYVARRSHRTGVGRRLYYELLRIVREQGFTNAFAGITLPNDASVALHQAMGFRLIGIYHKVGFKLGRWHDTSWWQLELRADVENPPPPVPWHAI